MRLLAILLIGVATAGALAGPGTAAVPFKATLTATGHTPQIGKPWYYTVRVTDRSGKPIAARIIPVVRSGNRNIDTVGFFQIYGTCGHPYTWQPVHRGKPLVFQVQVRAEGGVIRLNYWIRAK